jgi:hypothetical protein
MRPAIISAIGILTITMGVVSMLAPYAFAYGPDSGGYGYIGSMDLDTGPNDIVTYFTYYSILMVVVAITLGISTLMQKKWTRKANLIFQIISIPIIVSSIVMPFAVAEASDFVIISGTRVALLMFAFIVLALLLNSKTKGYYQSMYARP